MEGKICSSFPSFFFSLGPCGWVSWAQHPSFSPWASPPPGTKSCLSYFLIMSQSLLLALKGSERFAGEHSWGGSSSVAGSECPWCRAQENVAAPSPVHFVGLLVSVKSRCQRILFSLFLSREIECGLVRGEKSSDSYFLLIWLPAEWEFTLLNVWLFLGKSKKVSNSIIKWISQPTNPLIFTSGLFLGGGYLGSLSGQSLSCPLFPSGQEV